MINGKKSLFYTVLMAGALMSCGGPKQAPNEEVAKSGNPVFEGCILWKFNMLHIVVFFMRQLHHFLIGCSEII